MKSRGQASLQIKQQMVVQEKSPLITGIEQKLNERQKKKDLKAIKSRFGFHNEEQEYSGQRSQPDFHVVNQLYDQTKGYLQKGRPVHTETFLTQPRVTARSAAMFKDDPDISGRQHNADLGMHDRYLQPDVGAE